MTTAAQVLLGDMTEEQEERLLALLAKKAEELKQEPTVSDPPVEHPETSPEE